MTSFYPFLITKIQESLNVAAAELKLQYLVYGEQIKNWCKKKKYTMM